MGTFQLYFSIFISIIFKKKKICLNTSQMILEPDAWCWEDQGKEADPEKGGHLLYPCPARSDWEWCLKRLSSPVAPWRHVTPNAWLMSLVLSSYGWTGFHTKNFLLLYSLPCVILPIFVHSLHFCLWVFLYLMYIFHTNLFSSLHSPFFLSSIGLLYIHFILTVN